MSPYKQLLDVALRLGDEDAKVLRASAALLKSNYDAMLRMADCTLATHEYITKSISKSELTRRIQIVNEILASLNNAQIHGEGYVELGKSNYERVKSRATDLLAELQELLALKMAK